MEFQSVKMSKTKTDIQFIGFIGAYAAAYPQLSKPKQQKRRKKIWCEVKEDPERYDAKGIQNERKTEQRNPHAKMVKLVKTCAACSTSLTLKCNHSSRK